MLRRLKDCQPGDIVASHLGTRYKVISHKKNQTRLQPVTENGNRLGGNLKSFALFLDSEKEMELCNSLI